jgi:hypothetical protein
MAPRKPLSGDMFNRKKIKEVKKKINKIEKKKSLSDLDKDKLEKFKAMLATTMAEVQQRQDRLSDEDLEKMIEFMPKADRPLEAKRGPIADRKKGGGKVYASQNKKYGGGIYPKMGK